MTATGLRQPNPSPNLATTTIDITDTLGDVHTTTSAGRAGDEAHELLRRLAAVPPDERAEAPVRAQAIEAWLPLAGHLARRFGSRGEPMDDLIQIASLGLIKAVDRYDADRGTDFLAFAVPTILGEIRRYFRDHTWDVRVPRRLQELRLAISSSTAELTQQLGHAPSADELADKMQVSRKEIVEGMGVGRAYTAVSLDAPLPSEDTGTELGEMLGQEDTDLAFAELRMTLAPALATLPEREQEILRLRFYGNMTQTEIAQRVGVSQMHVSRLLSRSLAMLREVMTEEPEEAAAPARGAPARPCAGQSGAAAGRPAAATSGSERGAPTPRRSSAAG